MLFPPQRHITIYETLKRIGDAEQRRVDTWAISLTSPRDAIFAQLPHSLEPVALSGSGRMQQGGAPPEAVTKARLLLFRTAGLLVAQLGTAERPASHSRARATRAVLLHVIEQ